jgi:hypothetical protein
MLDKFLAINNPKQYSDLRREIAEKEAQSKGLVVVEPSSHELFVDIDSEDQHQSFTRAFAIFRNTHTVVALKQEPSPSRQIWHWHMTITLKEEVDARTRILYQAVLGSDPVREVLSLQRLECGDKMPTLFFERA